MNKQLKDKAISIKGNEYVLVKDRIIFFNATYKNGAIHTKLLSEPEAETVVVQARVYPDADTSRYFTGLSQAKWGEGMVNKTAALENAETSAVGRALAMMGIGVIDSVASADEMSKAGADEPDWLKEESEAVKKMTKKMTCPIHNVLMLKSKYKDDEYGHMHEGKWCKGGK